VARITIFFGALSLKGGEVKILHKLESWRGPYKGYLDKNSCIGYGTAADDGKIDL